MVFNKCWLKSHLSYPHWILPWHLRQPLRQSPCSSSSSCLRSWDQAWCTGISLSDYTTSGWNLTIVLPISEFYLRVWLPATLHPLTPCLLLRRVPFLANLSLCFEANKKKLITRRSIMQWLQRHFFQAHSAEMNIAPPSKLHFCVCARVCMSWMWTFVK